MGGGVGRGAQLRGALFLLCDSERGAAAGGAQEALHRSASPTFNYEHSPRISSSARSKILQRDTLNSCLFFPPAPLGEIFGYFLILVQNRGWDGGEAHAGLLQEMPLIINTQ